MAAAASDKARFFLERSVPELQGYKETGVFSTDEISSIAAKRSAFEHRINMPGASSPGDFARYVSYETNLETLRKKRCKRLGIRSTNHAGQKRVFSILERGTRKFPGDLGLWMQYLEFCKEESSSAKLAKGLTKILRMHPVMWELWVWGAKYYFEQQGDIGAARSYMQRGLRFCSHQRSIWIQYLRLEMIYLAKLAARRKLLKLDERVDVRACGDLDGVADEVALPTVTQADLTPGERPKVLTIDDATLRNLSATFVSGGAIPIAIIDAATKNFRNKSELLLELFDCVYNFSDVPSSSKILDHIIEVAKSDHDRGRYTEATVAIMTARARIFAVHRHTPEFPPALHDAIKLLKSCATISDDESTFLQMHAVQSLTPLLEADLDHDIYNVLIVFLRKQVASLSQQSAGLQAAANHNRLA